MASTDRRSDGSTTRVELRGAPAHLIELKALHLRVTAGPQRDQDWILTDRVIRIGSHEENDVVLEDPRVSRHHARIAREGDEIVVTDLGSRNGTFAGGVRLREGVVPPGTDLVLGGTTLRVVPHDEKRYAVPDTRQDRLGDLVGTSAAMRDAFALIRAAAPSKATVLLSGESGTGKELAARLLHTLSGRSGPLVVLDCGRAQPELLASEVFGHVRGAFTGADRDRAGAFRQAAKGTLFLDEIGDLPLPLQASLLRVIETREVQPLGADRAVPTDIRLVTATHRNLVEMVKHGQFREDLYHRLCVIPITLPPLRERTGDIPRLVEHFRAELLPDTTVPDATMQHLARLPWPGNVRALRNALERLGVICRGRAIEIADLEGLGRPAGVAAAGIAAPVADADPRTLDDLEKEAILSTFDRMERKKKATARVLGISLNKLKRRLREYGVVDDDADE